MQKQIFIINGSGGTGKDTFVNMVRDYVVDFNREFNTKYKVWNFSSVDKVKLIASIIGWKGGKTEKDRKFLSDIKVLTTEYNDMPFNDLKEKTSVFNESPDAIFAFLHIREPNEIARAANEFGAKTILVKRDSVPQITSNIADGSVFNYNYDLVIENDGDLNDLREKANTFAKKFLSEE